MTIISLGTTDVFPFDLVCILHEGTAQISVEGNKKINIWDGEYCFDFCRAPRIV